MTIQPDFRNLPEVTNDSFWPLFSNESRYLVLAGGGGSGKSIFAGNKVIVRVAGKNKHRFLVVRKVAKTLRESCFAQLVNNISAWGLSRYFRVNKTDMQITCTYNGNQILFAGLDDAEKLKSIYGITGIWIEEASELEPEDFRQLDIRLRGQTDSYKQIIFTFNPIHKGHWLEKEFVGPGWTAIKENSTVHHSTYKDNRFLDNEQRIVLESFKDTDEYYYTVYCLGQWGVLGKTIFPAQIVSERIAQLRGVAPVMQGMFVYEIAYEQDGEKILDESIQWIDDADGYIAVYHQPEVDRSYVVGGDTAGDGSDYFTGQVLDSETGKQMATLKHQTDEDLYARQMYCLGKYYNYALLNIEANFSTYPIKVLQQLKYHHQYRREAIDQITNKKEYRYGWLTTTKSRPLAIANLVKEVRDHADNLYDLATLEEMLTFVRNEKGKAEAKEGEHDDLILALAIAHQARGQGYYPPTSGSFLAGGDTKRRRYDFNTELGRDDDDDEEGGGIGFYS